MAAMKNILILIVVSTLSEGSSQSCYTPDGEQGQCVNIHSCPHLAKLLQQDPVLNRLYVKWSRCYGAEHYSVCCGPPKNTTNVPVRNCGKRLSAFPLDPKSECCGIDSNSGNRMYGGVATSIDDYPWLALIEYKKGNLTKLLCGGALISYKYVLTAAHCVTGKILKEGTPTNVRLGEYDASNAGPDCVSVAGGGIDCTDPVVIISIERTIPHPDYGKSNERDDIALIRLQKMTAFTDFISPICLPTTDIIPPNIRIYVAGWGNQNSTALKNVKQHMEMPLVNREQCQAAYNMQPPIGENQICAGGEGNKVSRRGDSGGPLMYKKTDSRLQYFELIGIMSFGTDAGLQNKPGIFTNVSTYDTWIRSEIRP